MENGYTATTENSNYLKVNSTGQEELIKNVFENSLSRGEVPPTRIREADQARRLLEKYGAKFFYKNGSTLLHHCIDKPPIYVYVLANGGVPVNIQDNDGNTALHLAAEAGNYDVAQALLQCSADLASRNKNGQTPLDVAEAPMTDLLKRHHEGVVQAVLHGRCQLLDRLCRHTWCSVGTIVKEGKNLIQLAMSRAETDPSINSCCRILHDYRSTSEVIHAVLSEDVNKLKTLLAEAKGYFVNVRYRDKLGPSLLSHAIESNNLDIARLLVDAGCKKNAIRIREHDTLSTTVPLCHKALQKHVSLEMIKYIFTVQNDTERTEKDTDGNTSILRAIEQELSDDVISWLLESDKGRCLVHRNQNGFTPREIALQKERVDVVFAIDRFVEEQNKSFIYFYLPSHFYGKHNLNIKQLVDEENRAMSLLFLPIQVYGQNRLSVPQVHNDPSEDNDKLYSNVENRGVRLFEAAARGDVLLVKKLNDTVYHDKNGYTALIRAIVFNQLDVVKYLCTSRPELKSTADNCNRYPLHYAYALPHDQRTVLVKALLEHNPEVIETRVDKDGRFPVEYKILEGSKEVLWMIYNARTLDAYGQRDFDPGSQMSPPQTEE